MFKKNKYAKLKVYNYLEDLETLKLIIENKGNVNATRRGKGENALLMSLEKTVSSEVFEYLLQSGIDVNFTNKEGNTAVHLCDNTDKLNLLIRYGADLNIRNKKSLTPIFGCNYYKKAKILVDNGADVNILDDKGNHFLKSINSMDFDLMKIFIDHGVNRFLEKRGLTLDTFIDMRSSIETKAYYENKLITQPGLFKITVR